MSEFNLIKIPEIPEFLEDAAKPAIQEIGKTLSNIFYAVFSPVNYPIEKLRIKQSEHLKKYEEDIKIQLQNIPEDNLIEPPLSIVGPALEASKYYIEQDEIREMFAKLIASSMNSHYKSLIRTSFTSIIKELEPLDASNLKLLSANVRLPVGDIVYLKDDSSIKSTPIITNLFLSNSNYSDHNNQSSSIVNLERLGLINIYKDAIVDKDFYSPILESSIYKYYSSKEFMESIVDFDYDTPNLVKGFIELTPFGRDFVKVCL